MSETFGCLVAQRDCCSAVVAVVAAIVLCFDSRYLVFEDPKTLQVEEIVRVSSCLHAHYPCSRQVVQGWTHAVARQDCASNVHVLPSHHDRSFFATRQLASRQQYQKLNLMFAMFAMEIHVQTKDCASQNGEVIGRLVGHLLRPRATNVQDQHVCLNHYIDAPAWQVVVILLIVVVVLVILRYHCLLEVVVF